MSEKEDMSGEKRTYGPPNGSISEIHVRWFLPNFSWAIYLRMRQEVAHMSHDRRKRTILQKCTCNLIILVFFLLFFFYNIHTYILQTTTWRFYLLQTSTQMISKVKTHNTPVSILIYWSYLHPWSGWMDLKSCMHLYTIKTAYYI